MRTLLLGMLSALCLLAAPPLHAQENMSLEPARQSEFIGIIAKTLRDCYVYPDSGARIGADLDKLRRKGNYARTLTEQEFARAVTADLETLGHDKHLKLFLDPDMNSVLRSGKDSEEADRAWIEQEHKRNHGFGRLDVLEGNVGYLELDIFMPPWDAAPTAVAAMAYLSACDAFIIDLRNNGGGWGEMVALLSTYFFSPKEQVHLSSVYSRPEDKLSQSWTAQWVPGTRFPDRPLYILTSKSTFSAAEEFSYNLKQLKRAVIVGETTRGGAHPVSYKPVGDRLVLQIPEMNSINPVSGGNWEGVGVAPDISATADEALAAAHLTALDSLEAVAQDSKDKAWRHWHRENSESAYHTVAVPDSTLEAYTGSYGPIKVDRNANGLGYVRGGRMRHSLRPISRSLFTDLNSDDIRFEFVQKEGTIEGLNLLTEDGGKFWFRRDK